MKSTNMCHEWEIDQALQDWRAGRAYIDGNGNYHIRRDGRASGPVAPWNRAAKTFFAGVEALHRAAEERG